MRDLRVDSQKSEQYYIDSEDAKNWMDDPERGCHERQDIFYPTHDVYAKPGRRRNNNAFELNPMAYQCKLICEGCKHRAPCLQFALDHHINDGIWGGLAPNERRSYSRRLTRAAKVRAG